MCAPAQVEMERALAAERANVAGVWWGVFYMLADCDFTNPSTAPIMSKLLKIPGPFKYALDHPLVQFESLGWTTSSFGTMIAAVVWGKSEGKEATFEFTRTKVPI